MEKLLGNDFEINLLIEEFKAHHYKRALDKANNKVTVAAKLLVLNHYQTLSKWIKQNNWKPSVE
jgi:hypothetical protein